MWKSLADRAYRHAYSAAHVGDFLAMQIHSMRSKREWTQRRLAQESGNTQPQISKFEDSCEGVNLSSLQKLAAAFDVALIVKFVPFSQLTRETIEARADATIPSFDEESPDAVNHGAVRVFQTETRNRAVTRNSGASGYLRTEPQVGSSPSSIALRV
jgi:transcriptional regulator with XRE-family HTH domain